jgi:hypothetical protein
LRSKKEISSEAAKATANTTMSSAQNFGHEEVAGVDLEEVAHAGDRYQQLSDHNPLHAPDEAQAQSRQQLRERCREDDLAVEALPAGAERAAHLHQRPVHSLHADLSVEGDHPDREKEDGDDHGRHAVGGVKGPLLCTVSPSQDSWAPPIPAMRSLALLEFRP